MGIRTERWPSPVVIAHRGSRVLWPENTKLSFAGAYEIGVRHFETDLRVTSDRQIVCFHDSTLDRTTDGSGPIVETSLAELQSLDAGARHRVGDSFPFRGQGVVVPTLADILTEFPDVSLVVDLKADGVAGPLAELLAETGAEDRVIVGSFSDQRLTSFLLASGGRVATSAGPRGVLDWTLAKLKGNPGPATDAIQIPVQYSGLRLVDDTLVGLAHSRGTLIHVWTVNRRHDMESLLDIGVDGIITDRPDIAMDVLVSRGR